MIDMTSHTNFDGSRLRRIVAEGSGKAVVKAAAYLRGVAKRKVKRRKRKSSPPGMPPYAHSGVFKASILFGVNASKTTAVIGPERLTTGRTNRAGATVPNILEYGGMAALGMNNLWIHKSVPRGVNDLSTIATYFRSIGRGPIAYGNTPAEADRRVSGSDNRKRKFARHPRRWSPVLGRRVYLTYIPITTDHQARKVAQTVVDAFGYPVTNRPIKIAARPLMAPTLAENREKVSAFWRNLT